MDRELGGFTYLFIQLIKIEFKLFFKALPQVLFRSDIWDMSSENFHGQSYPVPGKSGSIGKWAMMIKARIPKHAIPPTKDKPIGRKNMKQINVSFTDTLKGMNIGKVWGGDR